MDDVRRKPQSADRRRSDEERTDPAQTLTLPEEIEALERLRIRAAMDATAWVQAAAARRLGLTARQLGYKLRKYGIEPLTDSPADSERG